MRSWIRRNILGVAPFTRLVVLPALRDSAGWLLNRWLWLVTLGRWQMLGDIVREQHEYITALADQREYDWEALGLVEYRLSELMRLLEHESGITIPQSIEGVRCTAGASEEHLQEALLKLRGLHGKEKEARAQAEQYEIPLPPPDPRASQQPT